MRERRATDGMHNIFRAFLRPRKDFRQKSKANKENLPRTKPEKKRTPMEANTRSEGAVSGCLYRRFKHVLGQERARQQSFGQRAEDCVESCFKKDGVRRWGGAVLVLLPAVYI
ncbi:hypothetical protein NL676_028762 [Syzygium grande]|nr:hypothetical protein NL676_028762 [Syzygium grande]